MPKRPDKIRLHQEAYVQAHYKVDMTAREIAAFLGIPRGTVIQMAYRLRLTHVRPKRNTTRRADHITFYDNNITLPRVSILRDQPGYTRTEDIDDPLYRE